MREMLLVQTNVNPELVQSLRKFNIRTVEQFIALSGDRIKKRALARALAIDELDLSNQIERLRASGTVDSVIADGVNDLTPNMHYGTGYRVVR